MQTKITQDTLRTLNEIQSMGYIKPVENNIRSYHQKITGALANFLKATPIKPEDALECMNALTEIGKNTSTFFSFFPKTMMDLYDWAASGDSLTQARAETKLLLYFSFTTPSSVEGKNRLLNQIQQMPTWKQRKLEVTKALNRLTEHYDQNGQFNEDPGLSVLKSISGILHQISDAASKRGIGRITAEEKSYFNAYAALIKERAPALYEDVWQEKFAPSVQKKWSIPVISGPVEVYSPNSYRTGVKLSRDWDRE
ncbi:MAG: hypothetical protein ACI4OR_04700 [Alphaproteobacteria bacterium]